MNLLCRDKYQRYKGMLCDWFSGKEFGGKIVHDEHGTHSG